MLKENRQTKIIFTIGPATSSEEMLVKLINNGVDVCRFNMAHASHEWLVETVEKVRNACRTAGREIALMMDVKGPEIRTRDTSEPILLAVDDIVEFSFQPEGHQVVAPNGSPCYRVGVNYPDFVEDMKPGLQVLVDSGLIRLEVEAVTQDVARCRVIMPGVLGSRRHINLPGVKVNLPSLTEKDLADIQVGMKAGIDFYALSFVREASDIVTLRTLLRAHSCNAAIIAKIEDQSGVANLHEIIAASDGMMVARGDLGIEVPFEQLPIFQRHAVNASLNAGKPVIIATHMLESMIDSPIPTRAEITDVSNAVRELADCVMLSGETTVGKYPDHCVDVLNRIIHSIQGDRDTVLNTLLELNTPKEKMLRSAVSLADRLGEAGILVFTRSGDLARLLSALRPNRVPIYAFTDRKEQFHRMLMLWGVEPFFIDFKDDPEETIHDAFSTLKSQNWAADGDQVIIITNVIGYSDRIIDSMQVRCVE